LKYIQCAKWEITYTKDPGMDDEATKDAKIITQSHYALSLVGQTLENRYRIEEFIGEGAMGYVYRGSQIRLRRTVAIKVPRRELSLDPEFMSRFEREALSMARCVHENIVSIYDVYVAKSPEDMSYIAMEYITGSNLHQFLRAEERNLTIRAILDILRQLARGIDAAHAAGVIHRDIKPSNMVITLPQRIAKIMDFGIAKMDLDNIFKTQVGFSLGTPAFMAPEQIRGEPPGPPADIYSFGMSLYKIFARSLPFDATTSSELLVCHLNEKPLPLRKRNPSLPKGLETALASSIAKNPDERQPTAAKLVEEIEKALVEYSDRPFAQFFPSTQPPSPVSLKKTLRWPMKKILLSSLPVLILLLAVFYSMKSEKRDKKSPVSSPENITNPAPPSQERSSVKTKGSDFTGKDLAGNDYLIEASLIDKLVLEEIRRPVFYGRFEEAGKAFENIDLDKREGFFNVLKQFGADYQELTLIYIRINGRITNTSALIRFRTGLTGKTRSEGQNARHQELIPSFETTAEFIKKNKKWLMVDWPSYSQVKK